MKIKSVYISNFKNFKGEHIFELNKNINIFYAENGFGKSSFFDALEWCLTGEINRFKQYDKFNDNDIINYNLEDRVHSCAVKIELYEGYIERSFSVENFNKKGRTQVKVEYIEENGKKITTNGKQHIDKLIKNKNYLSINSISNIKQTHILSQDQITNFINSEKPAERYQHLLSIMGIENKILIDNLTNISKRLGKNKSELEEQIDRLDNRKKEVLQDRKDIKKSILINKIENLKIDELKNYDNFIDLINGNHIIQEESIDKNIEDKLKANIIKYKEQFDIISKIQMEKYKTIESFIDTNSQIIKENNNLKFNLKKNLLEKQNLENKITSLLKEENKFSSILNIRKQINDINVELKNMDISDEGLKKHSLLKMILSQITYTINNKDSLVKNKLLLGKGIEEKNELESSIDKIELQQEISKKKLKEIERNLFECDNKQLIDLIDGLEKIKKFTKKDMSHNNCPVCNSDITSIDIEIEVNKNINVYKNLIAKSNSMAKELMYDKESLLKEIELKRVESKRLKIKLNKVREGIEELIEKIDRTTENRLYNEDWFSCDIESLKTNERLVKEQIEKIESYKKLLIKVNSLENKHEEELKLVEENSKDFKETISNLKDKLNNIEKQVSEMKELEEKLEDNIDRNNKILYTLDEILLKDKNSINIKDLKIDIEEKIKDIQAKIKDIEDIHLNIENYIFNIGIDQKVTLLEKDIIKCKNRVNSIGAKVDQIDLYIRNLNDYAKGCIEKYLNNNDSPVKKYYNYLNPMPIKQSLHFNTNDEEQKLSIEIKDNDKLVTRLANKTLSSGQLNVLALSIFLAMNEYQQINNLDVIAIDDPIQNMDDINQFSVCDILNSINKQIIFSTHDVEFLKLFLKKNNDSKGKIRVFSIESPYLTSDKVRVIDNN